MGERGIFLMEDYKSEDILPTKTVGTQRACPAKASRTQTTRFELDGVGICDRPCRSIRDTENVLRSLRLRSGQALDCASLRSG